MRRQIVELLGRSERPLSLTQIREQLPDVRRAELVELVERGVVYPCTRGRWWDRDESTHHAAFVRAHLEREPLSRRALAELLGERDPELPRAWRLSLYDRLRDTPDIWEWPSGAGERSARLAARPPDPDRYLDRVREQYERVRDQLSRAGVDEGTIAGALIGEPTRSPAEVPSPTVLHELAFAWADAPAARAPIERVLINVGATRLGEVDEAVLFDGRIHQTDDDLFPDEPARVVEPGWVHGTAQQRVVLVKARVRAAP